MGQVVRAPRFETPAFDPRGKWSCPDAGEAGMAAREPLRFDVIFAFDIRQREMAEESLRRAPGTVSLVAGHRPAKQRELHTVFAPASRVFEGGGEIPPLLAKPGMGTVIARKLERSAHRRRCGIPPRTARRGAMRHAGYRYEAHHSGPRSQDTASRAVSKRIALQERMFRPSPERPDATPDRYHPRQQCGGDAKQRRRYQCRYIDAERNRPAERARIDLGA